MDNSSVRRFFWMGLMSLVSASVLLTCASEGSLSGGPPDTTPPTISFNSPAAAATNVPLDTRIKLQFSEKMVQSSVRAAVQVVPEPPGGFEVKTTWRKAEIRFPKPLSPHQTYLVTLDKSATDLRQNGLDGTFVLAFSTGEKIDRGVLAGEVVAEDDIRRKGQLLLYNEMSQELDSLRLTKPAYAFQPSDTGTFVMPYLAEHPFVLFYHFDKNQNGKIDAGDYFGRPSSTTVYPQPDSATSQIKIRPALMPPRQLKLLGARKLSATLLRVRFTRPVDRVQSRQDVRLYVNNQPVALRGLAPVQDDEFSLLLQTVAPLMPSDSLLTIRDFVDTTHVRLNSDTTLIKIATRRDSINQDLLSIHFTGASRSKSVIPNDQTTLTAQFALPIIQPNDSIFTLQSQGNDTLPIPGKLSQDNTTQFIFTPDAPLPSGTTLAWTLNAKPIRGWQGETLPDTLYSGKLKTISPDSLGRLIIKQNSGRKLRLVVQGTHGTAEQLSQSDSTTIIPDLYAGDYSLWAYDDLNSNGQYDTGGFGVHSAAEPFWVFPDAIHIRARWDYDVGLWDFNTTQ